MAKSLFRRNKPVVNIGTIGHIDHGKTTLTSAILKVQSENGCADFKSYEEIAKGGIVRDKNKTVTVTASHVRYESEARIYTHIDCPGQWRSSQSQSQTAASDRDSRRRTVCHA